MNIKHRLTRLETQAQPQVTITSFRMIADSEVEQHHKAMLKAGYKQINQQGSIFVLWQ